MGPTSDLCSRESKIECFRDIIVYIHEKEFIVYNLNLLWLKNSLECALRCYSKIMQKY